jgi:hypothetical protein
MNQKEIPSWRDVFDGMKANWGNFWAAKNNAYLAGYKFLHWNGRIYKVDSEMLEADFKLQDLKG